MTATDGVFAELTPPYSTIVADPPWRYYGNGGGRKGDPGLRYSTMTFEDIAALPVADIAGADAHLYLWATCPFVFGERNASGPGPVDILEAWGFRFVTLLTWVKPGLGLGHYFRVSSEHILFGVRGKAPIPPTARVSNVVDGRKGHHSAKPDAFGDIVEQVSPGPYVELFCRRPRLGWDSWGYGYEQARTA
jgi:N6-adenosine-specific RNA methylase IME4